MSSIRGAAEAGKASNTATRAQRLALLTLSFQTLGIIYSDIGTSPLYTLNGIWPASSAVPPEEDVIGGLSAIIWALTLLPLLKYVFICLRFGTMEGEGGTFALYQGLYPPKRHVPDDNFVLDPLENEKEASTTVSFSDPASGPMPDISPKLQFPLFVWCLFGTALTLADGIFTPAVSVTSAVAATFVWLILLAATGIVNIISYPAVFRAFDPSRAIMLFVRTKNYDILAGVLLALTGCEAMFASLGHFNMLSIQLSFSCFVYPSVVLAYLGQGARLVVDGETALANLFYATIPGSPNGPLYWIMFVFGILATFIASQTLITASFSLIQQLIKMHVLPPLRIVHTSETHYGQIYIPAVNWILMIVTIIVVATFKDPVKLTNAYGWGFSLSPAVQMKFVKHLHVLVVLSFFLVFGFLDGLFWGAALKKVPQGAWVPLIIGIIMITIMLFWSWAKVSRIPSMVSTVET
ncbi:hypothetical protein EW026_g7188 [Hermanssonia centrifuga]|uniref:K+ potassium transporter integral membrane domain-containing protein n=1 Tax=Hermanssonia centrifuga TaxID=98765 RepID=A0A4S4KAE9_9APHY|nr:hypothetical protein EW026_g7188 [Hermanssonia centrifuga]